MSTETIAPHVLDTFIASALKELGRESFVVLPEKRIDHLKEIMHGLSDALAKLDEAERWRLQHGNAYQQVVDERDAAIARAEKAEGERDEAQAELSDIDDALTDETDDTRVVAVGRLVREHAEAVREAKNAAWDIGKLKESLADRNSAITQLSDEAARDQGIIVALQKFKSYVHTRLDSAGVPKFDDGRECRVGARLDHLLRDYSVACSDIEAERARQKNGEGWTESHDDEHTDGSLASAAAAYALPHPRMVKLYKIGSDDSLSGGELVPFCWPKTWAASWWKPHNRRHDLVRAGALIVAEIERLDRATYREFDALPGEPSLPTTLPVEGKPEEVPYHKAPASLAKIDQWLHVDCSACKRPISGCCTDSTCAEKGAMCGIRAIASLTAKASP